MDFVQIKIYFDQFFFNYKILKSLLIMSSINLSLHVNSLKFCVHRDFGAADYEFDVDFENLPNSKWQKLKKF